MGQVVGIIALEVAISGCQQWPGSAPALERGPGPGSAVLLGTALVLRNRSVCARPVMVLLSGSGPALLRSGTARYC